MDNLQQCLTDVVPLLHPRLRRAQVDSLSHQSTPGNVQHGTLRFRQRRAAHRANIAVVELRSCGEKKIVETHTVHHLYASGGSGKVAKNDAGVLPATR